MKVNIEKEQNNIVKIDIEVPAKDAVTEYNKAAQKISQYANIPGFRKGKAPRNIVEKHVGVEAIKQEALEYILPKAFQQAILDNKLDVISQPYVESYNFEVGENLKVTAKAELRPEVSLGEYKGMKIEVEEYITPDDAFDQALDNLLQRNAEHQLVIDKPATDKNLVIIDFDGTVNGEVIQGGKAESYPLDLGNSNFIPGFAEQIVGHSVGEEFDIKVDFPKEYHEKTLAGQPAVFKIKLKEIKEKVLPELTDEFAQKIGPFKTVDELKEDIQKFIDTTKEREDKKKADNAIFEKVLSAVNVDIQESMVEKEAQSLLDEYKQRLSMQGHNADEIIKNQGQEAIMQELKKEALMRIKNSLVLDKIAQEEEIKIEQNDLENKFKELEGIYRMSRADLLKQVKENPAIFSSISQQALNEKVMKFLSENNEIQFKKPGKK